MLHYALKPETWPTTQQELEGRGVGKGFLSKKLETSWRMMAVGEQPGTERTAENGIILEVYVVKEGKGKTGWRGVKFMACFQQCQHHCV